ncbi:type II toxin-antitoxin system HipA family toxin [Corynebacterium sp. LK2510]|uniref:type II toxin-antitoxin system HipA family toxin n=1 Tax=Corynebacterium sp. LK2510 TaxID=3110472 RepID=UPI0034CE5C2D
MTRKTTAYVWAGDALAATIVRDRAGTKFQYLPEYVQSSLPAIATTLPKSSRAIELAPGQIPPFFAGLLPEGRRLSALRRSVKTSADDDLGLLLAVGGNTVGNVSVLPEGKRPKALQGSVNLAGSTVDFSRILMDAGVGDPHSLAGVQDKASARTIAMPIGGEAIVKLSPPEYPGLVENEFTCLQAYRTMPMAKQKVVDASILHDMNGLPGLVVERFDGTFPEKYQVEDAAQLLGIYPADKYNVSYEELCHRILAVTAAPMLAARDLMLQLAFAWLSGNGDLHAKNISVINRGMGYELSPVYDVPSTVPYGDYSLALEVGGRKDGLSRKRFAALCLDVGLTDKLASKIAAQALAATDGLARSLIDAASFDPRRARDLTRHLRSRRQHW